MQEGHFNCFPAWVQARGRQFWLTDENMDGQYDMRCPFCRTRATAAIGNEGTALSMFPVPIKMAQHIQEGKLKNIMLAHGWYAEVHVDDKGHLHRDGGPAVVYQDGDKCPMRLRGTKVWYQHGKAVESEES